MKNKNTSEEGFFDSVGPTIIERLPVVMAARRVSTRELAFAAGTGYLNMARLLRGGGKFKAQHIVGICAGLRFPIDGLTGSKATYAYNVAKILR